MLQQRCPTVTIFSAFPEAATLIHKRHKFHRTAAILLPSTDDILALPTVRAVRCRSSLTAYFSSFCVSETEMASACKPF